MLLPMKAVSSFSKTIFVCPETALDIAGLPEMMI